jgi:hypothetical protein
MDLSDLMAVGDSKIAFLERKLSEAKTEANDGYLQGFWDALCPDCDATHDQAIEWTERLIAALKDESYDWGVEE